jgi:hypothetical protein
MLAQISASKEVGLEVYTEKTKFEQLYISFDCEIALFTI